MLSKKQNILKEPSFNAYQRFLYKRNNDIVNENKEKQLDKLENVDKMLDTSFENFFQNNK
tara:strand:- start:8051 stop:8230 length:180 start_codon:yes stop_codon:yes gene_type:complete